MSSRDPHDVTQLLGDALAGDAEAVDNLWSLTYPELRGIARRHLHDERADHTLSPTALVHEAWIRMVDQTRVQVQDRGHFFALVSGMCRRVLVDHARKRLAAKRGGGAIRVTLHDGELGTDTNLEELLALDQALERLGMLNPRLARVVDMRYFGGLSEVETASALEVDPRTVRRDLVKARGFLHDALGPASGATPGSASPAPPGGSDA